MRNTTLATLSVLATSCAWASSWWLAERRSTEPAPRHATADVSGALTVVRPQGGRGKPLGMQAEGRELTAASPADDRSARMTPVVRAVERSADSVVSIYVGRSVGRRTAPAGQGSGVILDASGLVITNWHVVAPAAQAPQAFKLSIRLRNDRQYPAKLLSSSPDDDLALLQVDPRTDELTAATLGESGSLMLGETVIAIGNPQGSANTVTVGVLSNRDKSITVQAPDGRVRRYTGLLQTDAAINQGNSGGALLDITGKLIGINNAMAQGAENIGFAIPVDTVRRVFRDVLLSSENLAGVWLGLQVRNLNDQVIVSQVTPGGPAARAGLQRGDRLIQLDRERIDTALSYARRLVDVQPGASVAVAFERQGREQTARIRTLTPVEREVAFRLGIEVDRVLADDDRDLVQEATRAALGSRARYLLRAVLKVRAVYPGSPAAAIGMENGDVITRTEQPVGWGYGMRPIVDVSALADLSRQYAGNQLPIEILRPGEGRFDGAIDVTR